MGLIANRGTTQFAYWKDGKTKQRLSRRIESTAEFLHKKQRKKMYLILKNVRETPCQSQYRRTHLQCKKN